MIDNIEKILVLVEMNDGNVHQVLASKEQKEIALHMMKNEKRDALMLSEQVEPFELEFKDE